MATRKQRSDVLASMWCDCSDPGCPCATTGHAGDYTRVYRIDMEDDTGTEMCEVCTLDALDSGLFTDHNATDTADEEDA